MPRPLYRVASNSYHALRFTVVHMGIEPLDSKVQIEKNVLRVSFGDLLISELKSAKRAKIFWFLNVNRYLETEGILSSISFF